MIDEQELDQAIGAVLGGGEGDDGAGDPYQDYDLINKRIDKAAKVDEFHRQLFERDWFRNLLFFVGQHWIIYESNRWRSKKLPGWYPRAQTNKFAEKENDLVATLTQLGRVPIRYTPANGDPDSIATSEIGERFREVLYEEAEIEDKQNEMAHWLGLTGNVFLLNYYDTDEKYGSVPMQKQQCQACGMPSAALDIAANDGSCPNCLEQGTPDGTPVGPGQFQPAMNEDGSDMVDMVPVGALCSEVLSPFELRIDHRIPNMKDQQRFVRMKRYDTDFVKTKYANATLPDGTPVQIVADANQDLSQFYLDIISHATSNFSGSGSTLGSDSGGTSKKERTTGFELFELPSKDFPQGLHAIRMGSGMNSIVEAGPLTSEIAAGPRKGQKFLPIVHFGFDKMPGRFWYKTRMDDVIPLQIFRNIVEANLRLTAQRTGNAMWLNPKGSGISVITGEPGQQLDYNVVTVGGSSMAKPERIPAELSNVQPLILLINKIDDSIERVSGTFFLQGGDTPPGVTAASALAYLGERASRSMSPLTREWAKGWKRWEQQALEIARANWTDDRIHTIAGRNKQWEVMTFKQADLMGSVKMDIDYNGLMPKSNATDRAEVAQLIQAGVINPMDPQQNYAILKMFGKTELLGTIDLDTKEATKENEFFMESATNPQPDEMTGQPALAIPEILPMIQNDQVHIAIHTDLCKTDEWKALPPEARAAWQQHIQDHYQSLIQSQQMMAGMEAQASQPPMTPGMQAAAQQSGGVPSGATEPDGRLDANGKKKADAQGTKTPDIAGPPSGQDVGIRNVMSPAEAAQ